eukprot:Mrub_04269.p1 GENE.Mrub_04269~~Mrub_04269.p1  ORF type:complete len:426 (+),score=98.95 Mrub_04269:84-1280(+)
MVKKLNTMSKTNNLNISKNDISNNFNNQSTIKTSINTKINRKSAVKLETLNNNLKYSKTDEIHTCTEIKGWYTIVSNVEGKNIKFTSDLEITDNKFQLFESPNHKSTYLDLKFNEIDFSSLDKLVTINDLSCVELSNLYGEVVYICDDDSNRILDLTDNIKVFMTSCKGVKVKNNSPTLDDQISREKAELAGLMHQLNQAVADKNTVIKSDYVNSRKKLMSAQDKQMQILKQRLMLEQVIQARENEEYRQIEKLISELELEKEKEKISNIIKEVEKSKYRQRKLIAEEQGLMSGNIESRVNKVQQQIMSLAVEGDRKGDFMKCSSYSGSEPEVKQVILKNDNDVVFEFCTQCCDRENGLFMHLEKFKCRTACKENLRVIRKSYVDKVLESALTKQVNG